MKSDAKHTGRKEIALHVAFWAVWVISFTLIQSVGNPAHAYFVWLMYYVFTLPVFMAHTYIVAYWLLPKTFFRGKYALAFAGLFLLLLAFSVIELILSNELIFRIFDAGKVVRSGYLNFQNIVISGIGNQYIILVFLAILAGRSWYSANNRKEELLRQKLETELEIYKYQLQPKLILELVEEMEFITRKNPEKGPELIEKVSGFLSRFLFEGRDDVISLKLDAAILDEFLKVHKFALGDRLVSNFVLNGNLQAQIVPPLLLLPAINNAIKLAYSCNKTFESTVIIKADKKYLLYSFTFWSEEEFRIQTDDISEITGNRLKYAFPGKYRLIENTDVNFFEYSLEIFN